MNISQIDLNLLVYLDVLLRERNVTNAAEQLNITQPAMSNSLKRLRELLQDPLLVRTGSGMKPTERALEIQPIIRNMITHAEMVVQPSEVFDPSDSRRVFRIMASDYAESTLIPDLLKATREQAPHIVLDILTPSDVVFEDIENGKVDMAINRFDTMPQSFHQTVIWEDSFSCVMSADSNMAEDFDLDRYLNARHVWVSKTGMGVGVGMSPDQVQRLGWVDEALASVGKRREIGVFTRHYQVAALLAQRRNLIATIPTKAAQLSANNPALIIRKPPLEIPAMQLKMAWSPLLHHNSAHRWFRQQVTEIGRRYDYRRVEPED